MIWDRRSYQIKFSFYFVLVVSNLTSDLDHDFHPRISSSSHLLCFCDETKCVFVAFSHATLDTSECFTSTMALHQSFTNLLNVYFLLFIKDFQPFLDGE